MKTTGIRIFEKKDNIVCINIHDILSEIYNADLLYWSVLYFYGNGTLKDGKNISVFEEEVYTADKGVVFKWDEFISFFKNINEIIDIKIIGCKDKKFIRRYEVDQEMYESCDVVIEMVDSYFWEIFAKDASLINRLAVKFKDLKFQLLDSDYEK